MQPRRLLRPCLAILLFALFAVALSSGAGGQHRRGYPVPPAPATPDAPAAPEPKLSTHHFDSVTMEREAKEMAAVAASIPGDIEQLKKGLLPSNAFDKLKRIEKLSKQLPRFAGEQLMALQPRK